MDKLLKDFVPGDTGRVKQLLAEGKIKRRLCDMGITPGAEIVMKKVAPLGDPIEITLRGYELMLRKDEAEMVVMEIQGGNL